MRRVLIASASLGVLLLAAGVSPARAQQNPDSAGIVAALKYRGLRHTPADAGTPDASGGTAGGTSGSAPQADGGGTPAGGSGNGNGGPATANAGGSGSGWATPPAAGSGTQPSGGTQPGGTQYGGTQSAGTQPFGGAQPYRGSTGTPGAGTFAAARPVAPPQPAPQSPSVSLNVLFETGSAELTYDAMQTLDQLGRALLSPDLAGDRFRIEGHTDTTGDPYWNQQLSEQRAAAVLTYLEGRWNIPAWRLQAVGMGEAGLLIPTPPQWPEVRNRRVLVVNLGS